VAPADTPGADYMTRSTMSEYQVRATVVKYLV